LHGRQVHTLASDVWRLGELGLDAGEARGIALRVADDGRPITFGFLDHTSDLALGLGKDFVGICITFVNLALAILASLDSVVECSLYLFRRLDVLDGDRADLYTSLVAIKNGLSQILHFGRDFGT